MPLDARLLPGWVDRMELAFVSGIVTVIQTKVGAASMAIKETASYVYENAGYKVTINVEKK